MYIFPDPCHGPGPGPMGPPWAGPLCGPPGPSAAPAPPAPRPPPMGGPWARARAHGMGRRMHPNRAIGKRAILGRPVPFRPVPSRPVAVCIQPGIGLA